MKKLLYWFFFMVLVGAILALGPVWGLQGEHLLANPAMTARIQAFDPENFTMGFDVYAANILEAPTALLFDMKDDYHLPSRFWGGATQRGGDHLCHPSPEGTIPECQG